MDRFGHGGEVPQGYKIKYDFSVNINPLGMPPIVKEAIGNFIITDDILKYPDAKCSELRRCISDEENVPADNILCGNGASELIMAICACRKPKSVLLYAPTFSEYERCALLYGAEIKYCSEVSSFPKLAGSYDITFICNPNNPTGELLWDESLLERVAESAEKNGKVLVVDECFIDFTHGKSCVQLLNRFDNLIVLKAFTKFFAFAGIRLGYMLASKNIISEVSQYCSSWNVSSIAQRAGCTAIREKASWKKKTLSLIDKQREFLYGQLNGIEGVKAFPSDANFILIKAEKDCFYKLMEKNILVRDCSNFEGLDDSYFRICISGQKDNELFIKALKEVTDG